MFCQFFDWSKKKTYKRLIKEGEHELSWIDHEYFINCKMFIGRVLINNFLNESFVALRAEIFEKIFLKIYGAYGSEMNIINSYLWKEHELPWIDRECFINSKWFVCGNMC